MIVKGVISTTCFLAPRKLLIKLYDRLIRYLTMPPKCSSGVTDFDAGMPFELNDFKN